MKEYKVAHVWSGLRDEQVADFIQDLSVNDFEDMEQVEEHSPREAAERYCQLYYDCGTMPPKDMQYVYVLDIETNVLTEHSVDVQVEVSYSADLGEIINIEEA